MTEPAAQRPVTVTLPPPAANGAAPPPISAPPTPPRRLQTRINGMRTGLIAGAAGTGRITQLRRIMRRDRRKPAAT
jgi:hypothetical protein